MDTLYLCCRAGVVALWITLVWFISFILLAIFGFTTHANAASFSCGRYMSRHLNVDMTPLALDWARKFPRVSKQVGAVVVQHRRGMDSSGKHRGGHVSLIVELRGECRALVKDNAGIYERDICKSIVAYVMPHSKTAAGLNPPPSSFNAN